MRPTIAAALVLLGMSAAVPARAQSLNVGDPAPKLEVKEFVKGRPVTSFEQGKTYVVEFWATWCGPCRTSIPHLTELQKKHPEVTFVGVSVWENNQDAVKPFVQQMGDKMAYRVAMDKVPAGAGGNEGVMAKTWMAAAGERGIPSAFIVNGQGKIAWIGHPMEMDQPLAKVAKGEWNLETALAERKQAQAQEAKFQALSAKLREARNSAEQLQVVDAALAMDPSLLSVLGLFKATLMIQTNSPAAPAFIAKLAEIHKDDAVRLNALAWRVVNPRRPKPTPELAKAALAVALRADKLVEGKDAVIADALARAYFLTGDIQSAVTTQERAVKLAEGTDREKDPGLKQRLNEYRKAAAP